VQECQTVLSFTAAGDDSDNWNSKVCKVPVKSPPPTQISTGRMTFLRPTSIVAAAAPKEKQIHKPKVLR